MTNTSKRLDSSAAKQSPRRSRKLVRRCKKSGYLPALPDDAFRIRSNYLHRLELETLEERRAKGDFGSSRHHPPSVEVLKEDHGAADESITAASQSVRAPLFQARKASVSFDTSVAVHEVPSRNAYSERVRKTIWMLQDEFNESMTRNVIEYMAEGCDPERVLEEEDFVMHNGELVHPVSLMRGYTKMLHPHANVSQSRASHP
jgi:hypothetical protein